MQMASSNSPPTALALLPLLMMILCLLSSADTASAQAADFNYLTLTWPGGYCELVKTCCTPTTGEPEADFLVVAMETYSSATGNKVTNCNSTCPFYVNPLSKLIDDLFAYWPSIDCPSNNGKEQWSNVWCAYGTCSKLTEVEYFNRTLILRRKVNLLAVLADQGIVPSKTKTYELEDIQDALLPSLGFSTVVECTRKRKLPWLSYEYYLYQIRICVSLDGRFVVGCPVQSTSSCGDKVWFLPSPFSGVTGGKFVDAAMINSIKLPSEGDVIV